MRGFIVFILTVVMLSIMAPMTVMACGTCDSSPVLAVSMEIWSDVMTAKARVGPDEKRGTHEGTLYIMYACSITKAQAATSVGASETISDKAATIKAMDKMGGDAILASGQPKFAPVKLVTI